MVTVQFEQSSFDSDEGDQVSICGELFSGSLERDVFITIDFQDVTATFGSSLISCNCDRNPHDPTSMARTA